MRKHEQPPREAARDSGKAMTEGGEDNLWTRGLPYGTGGKTFHTVGMSAVFADLISCVCLPFSLLFFSFLL